MEFPLKTLLDPGITSIKVDLERSIEDVTKDFFKEIAEDVPEEMRALMSIKGGHSTKGEAPHRQSGNLAETVRGELTGAMTVEIELAEYAKYLDPFLGGDLDRPFIEQSVARSLDQIR